MASIWRCYVVTIFLGLLAATFFWSILSLSEGLEGGPQEFLLYAVLEWYTAVAGTFTVLTA
jgi:hypothetical protein